MKSKMHKKIIVFLLLLSLFLMGCNNLEVKQSEEASLEEVQQAPEEESEAHVEKTRKIVDMAGRTVEVPTEVKKVFPISQIGTIVLYSINPDKLVGWGFPLNEVDKQFIDEKYHGLPVLGSWSGKDGSGNIEEIIRVHPDVIFSIGTMSDSYEALADRIHEQTGIPVVMVDGSLDKLDKMYEFVGDILGEQERTKELGDYCAKTIIDVKELIEKIPEEKRIKVYYAQGHKGLETDPKGSFHTEVLDFVGGINVAEVPVQEGFGRTPVSIEQLLKWNPEVIIVGFDKDAQAGFFKDIHTMPEWQSIQAIKDKRVYAIPNKPYDWFDRPPSVNRIIGVKWLSNLLYPETVDMDIVAEVKVFYEKFYHKKLTDVEVGQLIQDAGGK